MLRYLAGTIDHGLLYFHIIEWKLEGFCDSDWGGYLAERKNTSRLVFKLGNGAVSWSSKKQDIIALSTTEAEYITANFAAVQAIWLRKLLGDCGCLQKNPTVILCDNMSTIAIAKNQNPTLHDQTKHIDIRYHYI